MRASHFEEAGWTPTQNLIWSSRLVMPQHAERVSGQLTAHTAKALGRAPGFPAWSETSRERKEDGWGRITVKGCVWGGSLTEQAACTGCPTGAEEGAPGLLISVPARGGADRGS